MKRRKSKKNNSTTFLSAIIFVIAIICSYSANNITNYTNTNITNNSQNTTTSTSTTSSNEDNYFDVEGDLVVRFIDVGQADSILIENENNYMLIDAGNNEDGSKLVNYFNDLGISKFNILVGTHPHEDHIGGLDDIISNFSIDTIYMPDVTTTTSTFESVIDAIDEKGLSITIPTIGEEIVFGDAKIKVLYTGVDSSDLNNTSIVLKLTYGNTSFLFMGDATSEVEEQILDSDISANVLKVGHHGSSYSSSLDFLKKVNPEYAVISVGENNSYSHPASATINNLKALDIDIYRTDELGTIIITSDGENITITHTETDTNG